MSGAPARITLRRVTARDAYALWLWANDESTRAASFARDPISWETHVGWLTQRLRSDDHILLLGLGARHQPVGVVRFDTRDRWASARLSYAVAPEQRRRGFGHALIARGTAYVIRRHPGTILRAEVAVTNEASMRIFLRTPGWWPAHRDASRAIFEHPPAVVA